MSLRNDLSIRGVEDLHATVLMYRIETPVASQGQGVDVDEELHAFLVGLVLFLGGSTGIDNPLGSLRNAISAVRFTS